MIRQSAAESLIKLLGTTTESLEAISNKFNTEYYFNDKLASLTGISLLLTDGLLSFPQQIVAVWILFNEFKNQPIKSHPFGPIFQNLFLAHQANPVYISPQLRDILASILSDKGFSGAEKESINTILSANYNFPAQKEPTIDRSVQITPRISPIIISNTSDAPPSQQISHDEVLIKILTNDSFWSNFEPPFIRPIPDVSQIFEGELCPILSYSSPDFLYDSAACSNVKAPIMMLLAKSADGKLKQQETNRLISEFKKDNSIFDESQFPQNKFATLIENNPDIAKEIVTTLGAKKPQILKQLQCLDITVNSVDVVKTFINSKTAPVDFLQGYAKNSIKLIQGIKDNSTMTRKTRIFCKLMIYFIEIKYPFTEGLVADLNQFCNDLSSMNINEIQKLREAL
jgi:hypothetical protein